jgi:hypothetical protein
VKVITPALSTEYVPTPATVIEVAEQLGDTSAPVGDGVGMGVGVEFAGAHNFTEEAIKSTPGAAASPVTKLMV